TRSLRDWSSDVCSSDLLRIVGPSGSSFTTTGTINVPSGRTLTVDQGTFRYNAGSLGGAGDVALASATAQFTPNMTTTTLGLSLRSEERRVGKEGRAGAS